MKERDDKKETRKRRTISRSAALIALLLMLVSAVWAQGGAQKMPTPRVYALVFKADWCANCRVLAPKAMAVLSGFIPKGVMPVALDMTSPETSAKALTAAGKLGLGRMAAGEDGTGFVLLVDARKRTKLGRITSNMTEAEMKAAFEKALSQAGTR